MTGEFERQAASEHLEKCTCDMCRFHIPVDVPHHLLQELKGGNVAIFAGAGVSTERGSVDGPSFYRQISDELNAADNPDFPTLMQRYVEQPDGRLRLIRKIRNHFDHIGFFPKLSGEATEFHRELSTLFPVTDIITTNWDLYFEKYCHATPFVTSQDAAYWDAAQRRVLKIHGSIDNFSTIVASNDDYSAAHERLSKDLIGSRLKVLLSTKNILFAGYSLNDSDFQQVYKFVQEQIGPFSKQAYALTIDTSKETLDRLSKLNIKPIYCDGAHFLRLIKQQITDWSCWLNDSGYDRIDETWWKVQAVWSDLHDAIDVRTHPIALMSLSYLDGLKHGLELISAKRITGEYSHRCTALEKLRAYDEIILHKKKNRNYTDIAYIEGFQNAILFRISTEDNAESEIEIPLFFFFGRGKSIDSVEEFMKELPSFADRHKAASAEAIRHIQKFPPHGEKIHWYHKCQI